MGIGDECAGSVSILQGKSNGFAHAADNYKLDETFSSANSPFGNILLKGSGSYNLSVGKIGNFECDFIVRDKNQNYAYIQVAYTLQGEDLKATEKIKEREYRPFRDIKDGYPRYIISLDKFRDQQEGVRHINAIDLFLGKECI
mgnify:CR=1 FL=1